MQVWDGSQQHCGKFCDLMACMEAAIERQLPPAYERDLVMLHTMKPHFDAVKQGGLVVVCGGQLTALESTDVSSCATAGASTCAVGWFGCHVDCL